MLDTAAATQAACASTRPRMAGPWTCRHIPRRPTPFGRLRLAAAVVAMTCLSVRAANAQECSTAICVGNPCTISGTHLLTDGCDLDFGSKTVTVAGKLMAAMPWGGAKKPLSPLRFSRRPCCNTCHKN